jgi:hypothetical protein
MLPLRAQACEALLEKGNPEGVLLKFLACQDRGDWAAGEAILQANGLRFDQIMWRFGEAVSWSSTAVQTAA